MPMTAAPETVRERNMRDVMRATRAAQKRIRRDVTHWYNSREGQDTTLDAIGLETLFTLAENELLDLLIFSALARERIKALRATLSDEGIWATKLVGNHANAHTAAPPLLGEHKQWCSAQRYVDAYRPTRYVFELRMGEVAAGGKFSSVIVRKRLQGWPRARRAIGDWLNGGEGSPS